MAQVRERRDEAGVCRAVKEADASGRGCRGAVWPCSVNSVAELSLSAAVTHRRPYPLFTHASTACFFVFFLHSVNFDLVTLVIDKLILYKDDV